MIDNQANSVVDFWLDAGPKKWWRKDDLFDEEIRTQFGDLHNIAKTRNLDHWRNKPQSCLALVLVLDQFSRNLFRGSAKTFAQDGYALELAKHAVDNGFDQNTPVQLYDFFFLPFMHSENLGDQVICVELFRKRHGPEGGQHAEEHREIIEKFGRFPHRNPVLGRETTREEQSFLDAGGFSG